MTEPKSIERRVAEHYAQADLEKIILAALASEGKDLDRLAPDDLAPVDEFHTGGRDATVEFAAQLDFAPEGHILDIGCGIGGPSRFFVTRYGCRVIGVDLTADFVHTAEALARRVGLGERVTYRQASALDLPFEAGVFDGAYMMHVGMNIEDKPALFAEIRRVLKPGGVFGVYDVMLMGQGAPRFPMPFAVSPENSFLRSAEDYRVALEAAGFTVEKERNRLDAARAYFREQLARMPKDGPPRLGLGILMKGQGPEMFANVVSSYEEGVLAPIELVARAR